MEVNLINVEINNALHMGYEHVTNVKISDQICNFDKYREPLERIAKTHCCTKIEVFERNYKFSGTIESGKIKISFT